MERKNKSPVWRVFVKDTARKRTLCTQCGKEFKYRYTTTNLRDHLKRYHPEWLPDTDANSSTKDLQVALYTAPSRNNSVAVFNSSSTSFNTISEECEPGRKNKSIVWRVFVKDAENKNVICTICQKEFKFWNNTTNLRAHLKRTHPEWYPDEPQCFADSEEEIECEFDQGDTESRRSSGSSMCSSPVNVESLPNSDSPVWRVFVKGDVKKGVFCALCQKHFSLHNEESMIDHLRKLHPEWEVSNELILKESNQDNDEMEDKEQSDKAVVSKSVFVISNDRKNRSPVWDVFIKDSTRKRSTCMLCKRVFKCYSNTANLLDHLRRIHPDWKVGNTGGFEVKIGNTGSKRPTIARVKTLSDASDMKSLLSIQSSHASGEIMNVRPKRLDTLIGEMICLDFQNLSIVEDTGFKKLMKELVPNYRPPNRKAIVKETLPELYDNIANQLRETLEKCRYVAISVELWTNLNLEGFMTLTVHYFLNEKYISSVLHTERINTEHSSGDLASVMHLILNEQWQIFDKITAIVTDDDAALRAACDILNITHIPCVAQLVNTMITEELTQNDDAQQLLQRCLNLVAHFKLNPSATDILHNIQSQKGLPVLSLKQVAPTRWNSALHMAQRLVELKVPLVEAVGSISDSVESLNPADWLYLEDFIAVLKPFELMTSELSADSYCNISKVVPLIRGVQSSLQNVNCVCELGITMKKSLLEKLETRFTAYEKYIIPSVATLLDPRFKKAGLGVESTIETTRKFVIEQLSAVKRSPDESQKSKPDEKCANSDIWNFLEKKVKESQKASTTSAEMSVKQYLDLPYLKRYDCPFKFWIAQSNLEPELSDIAMKFMCIPATSFPADRLYSKSGISITERRNRMTTKHFDTIIFLNKNL